MATARQIAANQANSARSRGPRTPCGKRASSANSYKHGLSGRGIVLPHHELAVIAARLDGWGQSLRPRDDYDAFMVQTAVVESVRVDRCRLHEVALRLRLADRAADFWDVDRRLAAAELAARLPRSPETIAWQLQRTIQGVDLLIGRWEVLGKSLALSGTWDDQQRATALDLLGVPRDQRQGWTVLVPDPGDSLSEAAWFAQHVECRLRDLRALRPGLEDHDAAERLRAMAGDASPTDAELKRLRRYERGCLRSLQWAVAQLKARERDGLPVASADRPGPDDQPTMTPAEPEALGGRGGAAPRRAARRVDGAGPRHAGRWPRRPRGAHRRGAAGGRDRRRHAGRRGGARRVDRRRTGRGAVALAGRGRGGPGPRPAEVGAVDLGFAEDGAEQPPGAPRRQEPRPQGLIGGPIGADHHPGPGVDDTSRPRARPARGLARKGADRPREIDLRIHSLVHPGPSRCGARGSVAGAEGWDRPAARR